MRKLAYLVALFVLGTLPAVAQESGSKDVSVEYSYIRANPATTGFPSFNANGGSASFAYNPRSWYGITGQFSGYHIGQIGSASVNADMFTYLFGPQLYVRHFNRFAPFAEELIGLAHTRSFALTRSHNSFAMGLVGGVDVPFRGHLSVRVGPIDYLMTNFSEPAGGGGRKLQNNLRVSSGVRWRF